MAKETNTNANQLLKYIRARGVCLKTKTTNSPLSDEMTRSVYGAVYGKNQKCTL